VLISDALNHASLIDGCRMSRARVEVVAHLRVEEVERCLSASDPGTLKCVLTESYFSMDGDGPDLLGLRAACDRHGAALIVDEAHALGVFGPSGSGRCREAGVVPDAVVGTLGKAVGTHGAFVAGSARLRELLWNCARSFVFSTAPSPHLCSITRFHVERARAADDLRARLHELTALLRSALEQRQVPVVKESVGPIVPVVVGDERRVVGLVERLADEGVITQAIRPPTVPAGTSRLRLTVKASWPAEAPDIIASALATALRT
jgi:8-amino-7-oxononanoate synthase